MKDRDTYTCSGLSVGLSMWKAISSHALDLQMPIHASSTSLGVSTTNEAKTERAALWRHCRILPTKPMMVGPCQEQPRHSKIMPPWEVNWLYLGLATSWDLVCGAMMVQDAIWLSKRQGHQAFLQMGDQFPYHVEMLLWEKDLGWHCFQSSLYVVWVWTGIITGF